MTNQPSDNFFAEMLTKTLGAIKGGLGTTRSGLTVSKAELSKLGVRAIRVDGSGLGRGNRTSARSVVKLLSALATNKAFTDSLAVAGRSGTIANRMRGTTAAGRCRAKTGTLSDVSALAGYCTTRTDRTLAFAMLMNGVDVGRARARQDTIVSALAGWRPGI